MTKIAFNKIAEGLDEALAIAQAGDVIASRDLDFTKFKPGDVLVVSQFTLMRSSQDECDEFLAALAKACEARAMTYTITQDLEANETHISFAR
jgi:uracil phosphoribosyltransferase